MKERELKNYVESLRVASYAIKNEADAVLLECATVLRLHQMASMVPAELMENCTKLMHNRIASCITRLNILRKQLEDTNE